MIISASHVAFSGQKERNQSKCIIMARLAGLPALLRPPRKKVLWCAVLAGILSCSPRLRNPLSAEWKVPEIALDGFTPAVKEQIATVLYSAAREPGNADTVGRLGMTLDAYGIFGAAAQCYERARQLDPQAFHWPYHLALAREQQGAQDSAITAMHDAVRLNPDYIAARLKFGELLLGAGKVIESLEAFQALTQSHPDLPQAHFGLARVLSAIGDNDSAITEYERACALFASYGPAHYAAGLLYRRLGRERQASRHFFLYKKDPDGVPPLSDPTRAEVRKLNAGGVDDVRRGVELEAAGRLREAAAAHEKALAGNPRQEQAHVNLISLYGRLNEAAEVEKHYRALSDLNPQSASGHYNYGVFLFQHGLRREAGEAFRKAIDANHLHPEAHHNYGFLLEQQGRVAEAERHYRIALQAKPDYRLARFHLGRILVNRKQYEQAIREFRSILEPADEHTPGYTYALAIAYGRSGRRKEALLYARKARDQAAAFAQSDLIRSIDSALKTLEAR